MSPILRLTASDVQQNKSNTNCRIKYAVQCNANYVNYTTSSGTQIVAESAVNTQTEYN